MSAFRGSRLLVSFGHHGLKYNRLHQRRIVSLRLTSLCQVTMKKQALLDTNALPVNKSDLSGIGILSPTSMLFSTEALALAGDEAGDVSEEDMEPGRVNKLQSPVDQPTGRHSKATARNNRGRHRHNTAFIGGYNFSYDEGFIKELFLQFGEVRQVTIPHKELYADTTARPGQLRYGFVMFTHNESLQKALAAKTITTSNGNTLVIKDALHPTSNKNAFLMDRLPHDVNVQQVYDYCQTFGKVQLVNLMLNRPSLEDPSVKHNSAVVLFNDNTDIILDKEHTIGTSTITVKKVRKKTKRQNPDRCCNIFLEDVAQHVTEEQVSTHFSSMGGEVQSVLFLKDKESSERNGLCLVRFKHQSEARHASEEFSQEIGGVCVRVRSLGIVIE